jgi:hypothetical protein
VAKIFANKFDLISPVWLQVTPTPGGKGYVMTGNNSFFQFLSFSHYNQCFPTFKGLHDVDKNWMTTVKNKSTQSKVKSKK